MRTKILVLLIIYPSLFFAQLSPITFLLGENRMGKISADTPASNSIQDIVYADNMVMLGTSLGLSISKDDGENWTNYYETSPFGNDGIISVGYDNGTIWTTTGKTTEVEGGQQLPEGTGLKYSTDGGINWTAIPQPIDDPGDSLITYGINTIRALPITVGINNISYDIAFTKNTVWISSFAGGLRKSRDMGETWERVILPPDTLDSIKPTDTLNFALQPVAGAFGPDSWLNHRVFSVVGAGDSTLYVGTADGINKSTDNGISWQKFNHSNQENAISGNFVVALGHDLSDNSIWAATWKANDLSEFWGVSYTIDGGNNWITTLSNEHAHNFGFKYFGDFPNYTGSDVFAPTDHGIFRSENNRNTWAQPSLLKDIEDNVPITTDIFYSATSYKFNEDSYYLWIGSNNGLSRIIEGEGDSWSDSVKVYLASSAHGTYAFPNPFSPALEIIKFKYNLSQNSNVTIRIMDFDMNLVRVIIQNGERRKGVRLQDFWDGRDETGNIVSNGVYFYRVDSESDSPQFGKIMVLR